MAKTKEELNELKKECEALTNKLQDLSEDELELVTGGGIKEWFEKIGEMTNKTKPVGSNPILGETKSANDDQMGSRQFWEK